MTPELANILLTIAGGAAGVLVTGAIMRTEVRQLKEDAKESKLSASVYERNNAEMKGRVDVMQQWIFSLVNEKASKESVVHLGEKLSVELGHIARAVDRGPRGPASENSGSWARQAPTNQGG